MAIRSNRRWRRSRIPEPVSDRGFCTQRLATLNAFEDDHSGEHRGGEDKRLAFPHFRAPPDRSRTEARKAPTDTEQQAAEARRSIARAFGHLTGSPRRVCERLRAAANATVTAAIVKAARDRELKLDKAEQVDSASGIEIKGVVSGKTLAIGNATLMEQLGIDVVPLANQAEVLRARGASVMHLAVDGKLAELLAVSDPVKASTQEALTMLRKSGLRIIMTTGDGLTTAQAVGKRLGIDEVHGEVKPEDKLQLVERLQRRYESSRWLVTASTTRPRSPKRMSASQWALSPTSR